MHRELATTLLEQIKKPFGGQPESYLAPEVLLRDFPPVAQGQGLVSG